MSEELDFNMVDNRADNGIHIQTLCGWAGEELAREQFDLIAHKFIPFHINKHRFGEGRRMMLYDVVRKVLNKDTNNYAQEIGDCVSFGAKNAVEYLMCCEMFLKNEAESWRPIFPPYLYGTSRVFVGKGQISDNEDGSLGSWMADAIMQYGVLAADEPNVPKYAGSVAKKWGGGQGPPQEFVSLAKIHPVKSAAKINSWDDLVKAVCNGYPCTIASDQGFSMKAGSDGYHNPEGNWAHQMCIIGVDDEHNDPYAIILNSWGDAHGQLTDFKSGETLPVGCIRARKRVIEGIIRQGETFAFSNFDGFPGQNRELEDKLFDLIP
jgi:hypothetical protein